MINIDPPSPSFPAQQKSALSRFLNRARVAVGLPGEVEVLLTSDAEIKRLNKAFRGKNKPTDILSFPSPPELAAHTAGDLAISLDTAARQAGEHSHTLAIEVKILLLHGLLHLAGEDHETDDGEMATREAALRRDLKLPISLIERASR
jgi:probable rRNA maturation factor